MRRIALCAAVVALLAARVCLFLGAGRTVRIAARVNNPRDPRPVNPRDPRRVDTPCNPRSATAPWIRDLSSVVIAVGARRPFSATCLEQGIALVMLLTIARIPANLVVGVARADSAFRAHAWVECDGAVVLGGAHSQGFTPLLRVPASSRPSQFSAPCPG